MILSGAKFMLVFFWGGKKNNVKLTNSLQERREGVEPLEKVSKNICSEGLFERILKNEGK